MYAAMPIFVVLLRPSTSLESFSSIKEEAVISFVRSSVPPSSSSVCSRRFFLSLFKLQTHSPRLTRPATRLNQRQIAVSENGEEPMKSRCLPFDSVLNASLLAAPRFPSENVLT